MATLPDGITQKELAEYLRLDKAIKKATTRHKVLNEKIKNSFADQKPGTYVFDNIILKLTEAFRFDSPAFEGKHPYDKEPQYYSQKVDTAAIEPDLLVKFKTIVERRMTVDGEAEVEKEGEA